VATFFQAKAFIDYWLDAVDEHSLQSPFFFDLYTRVIDVGHDLNQFTSIENLRKELLGNKKIIQRNSPGSESVPLKNNAATISDIARTSLGPQKFLSLYNRIAKYFLATNIIELGTSFGISTLYLATAGNVRVTSFEGSPEIASIARLTFDLAQAKNINLVEGNIDSSLQNNLTSNSKVDLAFIDANHRYEPTLRYFNQILSRLHSRSVVIMDDIHYSEEMQRAWTEIREHKLVYATVDLYRSGLVFFDPSVNKQHVVLQF
jgi:predicted O-methyltransferase YrrM